MTRLLCSRKVVRFAEDCTTIFLEPSDKDENRYSLLWLMWSPWHEPLPRVQNVNAPLGRPFFRIAMAPFSEAVAGTTTATSASSAASLATSAAAAASSLAGSSY